MGKKRPVFPFTSAAGEPPRHLSDYGFDPQLLRFSQPEAKLPAAARRHHQHPPPLESARFNLQKPISKKQHHKNRNKQRRRWWSSAASAALLFFKRSSSNPTAATAASLYSYSTAAASAPRPLYFTDDDAAECTCWAPAMRSGHLAAAELGAASAVVPYVSLRDVNLGDRGSGGGAAPAMPIYLVT